MSFKNTHLAVANILQSKGNLLDLSSPIVMGIINTSPDSFFEGSRMVKLNDILEQASLMISQGAQILDIGGASTRPGAEIISIEEELSRITEAIKTIHQSYPKVFISVDTFRAEVARKGIESGGHIVNDISGGLFDDEMIKTVAELEVPFIAMHNRGNAETMHQNPSYENICMEIIEELKLIVEKCNEAGIKDLILDPGFGFAKNQKHNYELLNNMALLRILGKPLLVGISRKSMIYKPLETNAQLALNGSTALHMAALQQGASILRVHDVKEAMEAIKLFELLGISNN